MQIIPLTNRKIVNKQLSAVLNILCPIVSVFLAIFIGIMNSRWLGSTTVDRWALSQEPFSVKFVLCSCYRNKWDGIVSVVQVSSGKASDSPATLKARRKRRTANIRYRKRFNIYPITSLWWDIIADICSLLQPDVAEHPLKCSQDDSLSDVRSAKCDFRLN